MAKKATEKKPLAGNRRSHSLRATKHSQKPNLQVVNVNGKRVRIFIRKSLHTSLCGGLNLYS